MTKQAPFLNAQPIVKIISFIFILLFSALIFTLFGMLATGAGLNSLSSLTSNVDQLIVIQIFSAIGTFIVPAFIYAKLFENKPISFLKLEKFPSFKLIVFTVVLFVLANFVLDILVKTMHLIPFESMDNTFIQGLLQAEIDSKETIQRFLEFDSVLKFLAVLFMMAIIPGIGEELTFRGVFMNLFHQSSKNIVFAIVFSGLLFAVIHVQLHNFLAIFFMGTLLGTIYYYTKNLWVSILAHFFNNGFIVLMTYLNNLGKVDFDFSQTEDIPLNLSIFGALIFFIAFYFYRNFVLKERKIIHE